MGRAYRVITALHGTEVPVPATYALCADAEVTGAPFCVMQRVDGTAYRSAEQLESLGPERTRTITLRTVDTLAAQHGVDPDAVGLGDFGRPAGFLALQVRRWQQQLDASRSRPLAGLDELGGRLVDAGLFVVYQRLGALGGGTRGHRRRRGRRLPGRGGAARLLPARQRPGPVRPRLLHRPGVLQAGRDPRRNPLPAPPWPDRWCRLRACRRARRAAGRGRPHRPEGGASDGLRVRRQDRAAAGRAGRLHGQRFGKGCRRFPLRAFPAWQRTVTPGGHPAAVRECGACWLVP
jgi:hypothetical protein